VRYEDCELVVISMLVFRLVRKLGFAGFEEFSYAVVVNVLRGIDKSFLYFRVLGLVPEKQLGEEMVEVEFFVRF
jgi:DNA-binding MurR/RpiR family transcriptional regulator